MQEKLNSLKEKSPLIRILLNYLIKPKQNLYVAHCGKIAHPLVQAPSKLDDHISRYKRAQINKQTHFTKLPVV